MKKDIWKYFLATNLSSNIIGVFKDIFLGIYFLKITDGNIAKVSLFYIVCYLGYVTFIYIINKFLRTDLLKSFRFGLFLNLLQCLCLVIAKERISEYIIHFAVLNSIANAFYCFPQQILIKRVNKYNNFKKYFSFNDILEKIINLVFPIIFGYMITMGSYTLVFLLLSIVTFISFIISFYIKIEDTEQDEINLKYFFAKIKEDKKQKPMMYMSIRSALRSLSSFGVIKTLIVILTYLTVNSELSLGGINSFTTIISIITIYVINRYINRKDLSKIFIPVAIMQSIVIIFLATSLSTINANQSLAIFSTSINIMFLLILIYNIVNAISNPVFELANKIIYFEFMDKQNIDVKDEANYIFYFEIIGHIFRSIGYIILIIASKVGVTASKVTWLIIFLSLMYIGVAYVLRTIDMKYIVSNKKE